MPRNTSGIFSILPGTDGFPDTTIESSKYNAYIHDVETDLNTPRPIVAGGTGAGSADAALGNLGAEKSSQKINNYDTDVFLPGSFYSDATATGGPAPGPFVGWAISSDPPQSPPLNQNVFLHARAGRKAGLSGRLYIREKAGGSWTPWSLDNTGVTAPSPPDNPPQGTLWWDSQSGELFVYYTDIDSSQWVIASPSPDPAQFLLKAGDTMQGALGLQSAPVADLQAANKKYVDDAINAARQTIPPPFDPGTTMLFCQNTAPTGWTRVTGYNDFALRITDGTITTGGSTGFSAIFGSNTVGFHNITAAESASVPVTGTFSGSGTGPVTAAAPATWIAVAGGAGTGGYTAGSGGAPLDPGTLTASVNVSGSITGTANGGGAGHTHPLNLNLAFLDVMMARKN